MLTVDQYLLNLKHIKINDTIVITGTPRSGTTWLMDILSIIPLYRTIFEPLNPYWFPDSRKLGYISRPYVPYNKTWETGKTYLQEIFTGNLHTRNHKYPIQTITLLKSLYAKKLIVKFVRLNRLLPWIANSFQLKQIFFIIRHPCAVIASQLNSGYTSYHSNDGTYKDIIPTIDTVIKEIQEIHEFDADIKQILLKLRYPEEILAAIWCIDNYIPLVHATSNQWETIVYEKLITNTKQEVNHLFHMLHLKHIPDSLFKQLEKPSMVTMEYDKQLIGNTTQQLSKWHNSLSEKQIKRIFHVIKSFQMDFYSNDPEPDYDALYHFSG